MKISALFLSLFASASAMELTPETWDEATAGKTIFVKFLAPVSTGSCNKDHRAATAVLGGVSHRFVCSFSVVRTL